MTKEARLERLGRAQDSLVRMLEVKHVHGLREVQRLQQIEREMARVVSVAANLIAGTPGLRRLADLEKTIDGAEEDAKRIQNALRLAKGRADVVSRQQLLLRAEQARLRQQAEGLEATLALLGKASRKPNVVK